MAPDRRAVFGVPAAAALLLWPALWNGYPIVFADTGTYLSQAIHRYAGWDRPVFYSLFMLPLHATVTLWPVVVAQALLTARVLWLVCRMLVPGLSTLAFVGGVAALSVFTWLPWIVSELMPDVFTPLLVLVVCLLMSVPGRLSRREHVFLMGLAAFMMASQQSSLPLACVLLAVLAVLRLRHRIVIVEPDSGGRAYLKKCAPAAIAPTAIAPTAIAPTAIAPTAIASGDSVLPHLRRRWFLMLLSPALALSALCTVNFAAHGRFSTSPFGNIFVLARVIYDGPGMTVLRRDCPETHWRLCPFLDSFPPTSDEFLWAPDSPLTRAGGPKAVSKDAGAIILAALIADPVREAGAALRNTWDQLTLFGSGDGLNSWPDQVSPWIERDFPQWERHAYASARQQTGSLSVPPMLARTHSFIALAGLTACVVLLPFAVMRRLTCADFLFAALLVLPVSAAITGGLSAPHDRYQSRIMWLPAFIVVVSLASLRTSRATASLPSGDGPALTHMR